MTTARAAFSVIAFLCHALSGPAEARESLPRHMMGLWSDSRKECRKEFYDGHMTIEQRRIEFAASYIMVRRWERRGPSWSATGQIGEEGEDTMRTGVITLRLLTDGRMQVGEGTEKQIYFRCADVGRRAS